MSDGCYGSVALMEGVGSQEPAFWRHIGECDTCAARAATIDPSLTRPASQSAPEMAVVRRALYEELTDDPLPQGGMYRTYKARDVRLGRVVVVKELPTLHDAGGVKERTFLEAKLRREADVLSRLQHPSIVPLFEAGDWDNGRPFLAIAHVDGRTVSEAVKSADSAPARRALLPAVVDAIEAMAYAHERGIIHRDVSPTNILLNGSQATVIDWSLAKRRGHHDIVEAAETNPSNREFTAAARGTLGYAPREQFEGDAETDRYDPRIDVHALGRILEFMVAGEHPRGDDDSRSGGPRSTAAWRRSRRGLRQIIEKATATNPEDRYPDAGALAAAVRAHQRWVDVSQRRALSGLFLACLLLVAGVVFAGQRSAMAALTDRAEATGDELSNTSAKLGETRARLTEYGETIAIMDRQLAGLRSELTDSQRQAELNDMLLTDEANRRRVAESESHWIQREFDKEKARRLAAETELADAQEALAYLDSELEEAQADLALQRKHADAAKQRAESERRRAESEKTRADLEQNRAETEEQRAQAEKTRADAEKSRADAEKSRADAATSPLDGNVHP